MGTGISRVLCALAGAVALVAGSAPAHAAGPDPAPEHERVVAFWTNARVSDAVPRDLVRDPRTGAFHVGRGAPHRRVLGSPWTRGGEVAGTTGKVVFAMGPSYYVCSASVVHRTADDGDDGLPDRSLVLTAAHCVFDEATGQFATNWIFVPDYDALPAALTTDGSFCAGTRHGCWVAQGLLVDSAYAGAGGFDTDAARHDVAVAVIGPGGHDGTAQLDDVVGSQPVRFRSAPPGADTFVLGYPAAGAYTGVDLIYSRGPLRRDPDNDRLTYRLRSDMTGGSSGGPWFAPFRPGSGVGVQISVTSYGYAGVAAVHGPVLNRNAARLYDEAAAVDLTDAVRDDVVVPAVVP